ncbi:MAG: FAD binding domain-containing protein [Chloroflexota bacterium]
MKPAKFEYIAPSTIADAVAALARYGDGAKVLAGGQSLVPLMNMRLARPEVIVDINGITELDYLRANADGHLAIGALSRQRQLERQAVVRERFPVLTEASELIGHFQIRNRGTIGGSLAHSDPSAELPAVMTALDAEFFITSTAGSRSVPASEFFVTYLTTALQPADLLTEIRVPELPQGTGSRVYEVSRRHGDFALVGAVTLLEPGANGKISNARIALFGVNPTPVRATEAEALLAGQDPSEALFREAGERAARDLDPDGDIHASAEYRKEVAAVVVRRALVSAAERMGAP